MKLLRYGPVGEEQPGLIDGDGVIRSLTGVIPDVSGPALSPESLERLQRLETAALPIVAADVRLGPCVGSVSKVIGVAQNYRCFLEHAGLPTPSRPILFLKPPSTICGPTDPIELPRDANKADWEVEVGVVIGTLARRIPPMQVMDHVAGYCLVNDITERGRFALSGQFVDSKSADTFTPLGPYMVTKDEIASYRELGIRLELNGELYQNGRASSMVFDVAELVSHISTLMTLMPGDIVATGTPTGVGARSTPPRFLRPGDQMIASVDRLGEQRSRVIAVH
jgi:2,4-diketo-3-deoxy-L-fuconate hydrolase